MCVMNLFIYSFNTYTITNFIMKKILYEINFVNKKIYRIFYNTIIH